MGLLTNDIGVLFSAFEKAYGSRWKQGSDAMPLWLKAMSGKGFEAKDVVRATELAISIHTNYPPSLGQFLDCLKSGKSRYNGPPRIEGPKMSSAMAVANRTMTAVLMASGGVKKLTLRAMIDLKNALVEDQENDPQDKFPRRLADQLTELMRGYEGG